MKNKKRLSQEEEYKKEYGFIEKSANNVLLEGFVYNISSIRHSVFDSNNIYISIGLQIYPQSGGSEYYSVICWNDLAKETEKVVNKHCKIRVEAKLKTVKVKNIEEEEEEESEIIQAEKVELLRVEKPLKFGFLGGVGTIECFECKRREEITSFVHGDFKAMLGYQCQSCGKFHKIRSVSKEFHKINIIDPLVCDCGGVLERSKSLFCPKCKSKRLSYELSYIT